MTGRSTKRQKSALPRLSRESFDSDNPHVEHVEVFNVPGTTTEVKSKGSGKSSSGATGPPNITSPPRALVSARAALHKLTKSPGGKQPESRRSSAASPTSPTVPVRYQAYEMPSSSNANAAANPPHSIPFDPRYMSLKISYGHDMPAPRWLLERKFPQNSRASVSHIVFPSLAADELEWVFDAGPYAHLLNSEDNWFSEYAYRVLESTLSNPIQRQNIRISIWNRNDGDYQDIEDPIPPLPPAPETLDVTRQGKGPTPGNSRESLFRFPGYERPSLAQRCIVKPESPDNDDWRPTRRIVRPWGDSDEEGTNSTPSASIGECKWIWFIVILLVLSMFLCLFLYAFKIIE